jgi:hypothetical protein
MPRQIIKDGKWFCTHCQFSDKDYDLVYEHEVKVFVPRKFAEWNKLLSNKK